jgi:Mg2+/Co2+ transporter CorC
MYVVHFFENKVELLNQLLGSVPAVGEAITIKGRKGKVTSVNNVDDKHVHVQIMIEKVAVKNKLSAADLAKKKKR